MKIKSKHLDEAVSEEIISKEQSVALRAFLESRADIGPTFNFTNLLYYFGGLIAIGAMMVLMNLGRSDSGDGAFFASQSYTPWLASYCLTFSEKADTQYLQAFVRPSSLR